MLLKLLCSVFTPMKVRSRPFKVRKCFMRCACKQLWCRYSGYTWGSGKRVLVFLFLFMLAGCGQRQEAVKLEEVYSNRANDKGYISSLMTNRQQQVKDSQSLFDVSLKMTQCVTRVKATLPGDAAGEALTKALAADPEWTSLEEQAKKLKGDADATLQQAKNMVVKRMQEEMRAHQAVAAGKARAIDVDATPKTVEKK